MLRFLGLNGFLLLFWVENPEKTIKVIGQRSLTEKNPAEVRAQFRYISTYMYLKVKYKFLPLLEFFSGLDPVEVSILFFENAQTISHCGVVLVLFHC